MESSDYSVQVRLDGAVIHEQPLDDPFVTTKTVLVAGWWCCLAGLFLRRFRTFKLVFSVEASPSALRRFFRREKEPLIPLVRALPQRGGGKWKVAITACRCGLTER